MPTPRARTRTPNNRPLHFESLEDRQLLSITVNTLVDENDGINVGGISLRDAIAAVAANDTINFAPSLTAGGPATILLTHGELAINKSIAINGPGADVLTIDANGNDPTQDQNNGDGSRIFNIDDGNSANLSNVSISGLTLTGGDVGGKMDGIGGGAILNLEALTISDTSVINNSALDSGGGIESYQGVLIASRLVITGNQAIQGGGLANLGGQAAVSHCSFRSNSAFVGGGVASVVWFSGDHPSLSVTDSDISQNRSALEPSGEGGGIVGAGLISLVNSTITGNLGGGDGGGVLTRADSSVTITNCTISNNQSTLGGGGGLACESFSAITIANCTISGNSAATQGGGIGASGATIVGCTIDHNSSTQGGGGIYLFAHEGASIVNCTVSDNQAASNGGGILIGAPFGTPVIVEHSTVVGNTSRFGGGVFVYGIAELFSTIVASNGLAFGTDLSGLLGSQISLDHSVIGYDNFGTFVEAPVGSPDANGNLIGGPEHGAIDPKLGPLEYNGGPTQTHVLLLGSPAINAGDSVAVAGQDGVPQYDQRGIPFGRVVGSRIDIGAIESQSNPLPGDYNFNGVVDAADYTVWRDTRGSATDLRADGNGSGQVESGDYSFWKSHFGNTLMSGAGASSEEPGASAESGLSGPVAHTGNDPPEASLNQQSAITNQQFLPNPQSTTLVPGSSHLAPQSTQDSALLLWLAAQPQPNLPINCPVEAISPPSSHTDDHSTDSSIDALDRAFDALVVNA